MIDEFKQKPDISKLKKQQLTARLLRDGFHVTPAPVSFRHGDVIRICARVITPVKGSRYAN